MFELGNGICIFVPFGVHPAQIGVSEAIERVDFDLLAKIFRRIVIFSVQPIRASDVVVSKLVIWIHFDLLVVRNDCILRIALGKVRITKIVPHKLVFRVSLHSALQQVNREWQIAILQSSEAAFIQLVRFKVRRRCRIAGNRALHRHVLHQVRQNCSPKRQVISRSTGWQLAFTQ